MTILPRVPGDPRDVPVEEQREPSPPVDALVDLGAYAIEVEGLTIRYGRTLAVRNLSMHVPRRSIYGLVGPAGAGKTATIRAIATLQQPDLGTVLVDGIDIRADPAAVRRMIGYLPDFSGVYEHLTLSEYLDFYGAIYRIPARRRRRLSGELLELVGLTEQRNRPVRSLSRGMKQQLGVARCLIHDPPILVLDEPAAGMAPRARLELRDILQELSRLGKTILLGSNLPLELSEVCTHLGIVRAGVMMAEGSVDEIVNVFSPDPRLRVRLLEPKDRETARRILDAHPACWQLESEDRSVLHCGFSGTEQDLAAILRELGSQGVEVSEYALQRPTLEDIFLQVTEMRPES